MGLTTKQIQNHLRAIPGRIAEVRGARSQRQFARDLGVFQQNINRYENGTTPHSAFLITLMSIEGISPTWVLTGKGPKKIRA